ncbi:protein max isoform X2 [Episyrphus balteatus]|uniref:protein max isoform X2 n=1 Tax=Episyrphus balteatus TaxID=286459 RepID=UPI002486A5E8|nr:protein max isoform X2 [Episyrphus balteatus]
MSDDDREIDIESDDDNDSDSGRMQQRNAGAQNFTQAEKRAHHNALERKRRDHIKDSFTCLREAVPSLQGEKASRAQILKKTAECIQIMRRKIHSHQKDVEDIKKQNAILEAQIRLLENARDGNYTPSSASKLHVKPEVHSDSSDGEDHDFRRRSKKLKTSYQP